MLSLTGWVAPMVNTRCRLEPGNFWHYKVFS
jgi:hypothetical protein